MLEARDGWQRLADTAAAAASATWQVKTGSYAPQISPCQMHRSQDSSPEHIARFVLGAAPCYWSSTASSVDYIHYGYGLLGTAGFISIFIAKQYCLDFGHIDFCVVRFSSLIDMMNRELRIDSFVSTSLSRNFTHFGDCDGRCQWPAGTFGLFSLFLSSQISVENQIESSQKQIVDKPKNKIGPKTK